MDIHRLFPPQMRRTVRIGSSVITLVLCTTFFQNCAASDEAFRSVALKNYEIVPADKSGAIAAKSAFRGAVALSWQKKKRFGGFSGLHVDRTGKHLTAISDRGAWFTGDLVFKAGRLTAVRKNEFKRLRGVDGEKLKKPERDAEALAADGSGGFVVAFERNHRILHYPVWRQPFFLRPRQITPPSELAALRSNHGLEAMTRLCDGRYLAISQTAEAESGENNDKITAWRGRNGNWVRLALQHRSGVEISGAATLSDCSVALVARERHPSGQWITGILRISPGGVSGDAGEPVKAQDVIGPFISPEKFEGIAAHSLRAGRARILLIADNDFKGPTVLVAFAIAL